MVFNVCHVIFHSLTAYMTYNHQPPNQAENLTRPKISPDPGRSRVKFRSSGDHSRSSRSRQTGSGFVSSALTLCPVSRSKALERSAAAHSHATMDAPHRQLEPRSLQGLARRKNVLIHAIDKGAIQTEKKGRPAELRSDLLADQSSLPHPLLRMAGAMTYSLAVE
jgi:hypothetical protein